MKKPSMAISTMDYKEEEKIWMNKPKLDENRNKNMRIFFYIHNVDEFRSVFLHCNNLCS